MTSTPSHRLALVLLVTALASGASQAADVRVRVTAQDGQPARDVVVWLPAPAQSVRVPAEPVVIEQRDLQFVPAVTVVRTGTTVRFDNRDPYDHHVRSVPSGPLGAAPPAIAFELRLNASDPKARSADIVADKVGITGLGCHLHSSMRGTLFVTDTPYFAKTDGNGIASLPGLPDGPLELKLWHADQLTEQPSVRTTSAKGAPEVVAQLNFTPRRRR